VVYVYQERENKIMIIPTLPTQSVYRGDDTGVNMFPAAANANNQVSNFASDFFPNPQRETVVSSLAGNMPQQTQGYRDLAQSAPTITPWYKQWWQSATASAGEIWNSFTGIKSDTKKPEVKTLAQAGGDVMGGIFGTVTTTLADYFTDKWGLTNRKSPDQNVYYEKTQSKDAATEPTSLADTLLSLMGLGSQPKGTYSIAYPQSSGIPTSNSGGLQMSTGTPIPIKWALLIGAGILVYIFVFKKKGHK
jgi:hypothetical protein